MNEAPYGQPRPAMTHDLGATLTTQGADPAAAEALAKDFLARVQRDIDEQVDLRVQQQLTTTRKGSPLSPQELGLALGSLGIGIPLSAIASIFGHLPGLVLVWGGLIIINVAWSQRR